MRRSTLVFSQESSERQTERLKHAMRRARCPRCGVQDGGPCVVTRGPRAGQFTPNKHSPRIYQAHKLLVEDGEPLHASETIVRTPKYRDLFDDE